METTLVKISTLKHNTGQIQGLPKNPRFIKDEKYEKLLNSLREDPEMLQLRELIAYDNIGEIVVICGNMRLRGLKELGVKEVPVKILPTETPVEKLRAYTIKDNVGFGEDDQDLLANEWDRDQLEAWGMDLPEFAIEETAEEDDYEIPDEIKTDIVLGDLFEIGEHRLLCGDSTMIDHVEKLMNGEKADMVFTDPPYNTGMTEKTQSEPNKRLGSKNGSAWLSHMFDDSYTDDEWEKFMSDFCSMYFMQMKDDSVCYMCLDWRRNYELIPHIKQHFHLSNTIVWDKVVHGLGSDYKYTYELINVCKKGKPELSTHQGDREYSDVWHIQRKMGKDEDHATKKPIEIIDRALRHASKKGYMVLDLFLGSGSTMVASHQLKRKCYGMELDPKYCQVIVDRMKKLDPSLIIKRNGEIWE